MSGKDTLSTVLDQVIKARLGETCVSMPAQIVGYDHKTQRASVQPTIDRRYRDGKIAPYPVINNVPVVFPRSFGASLTFPVRAGDTVLLVFTDRSMEPWLGNGGTQVQNDPRMHSLNDAVAFPGLIPFSTGSLSENNDDVLMTYDKNNLRFKPGGNSEIVSEQSITFRCGSSTIVMTPTGIRLNALRIDLN